METSASSSSITKTDLCPHFGSCGGCATQDVPYPEQLERKRSRVSAAVGREVPIAPSPRLWHYRNKMEFSFGQDWGAFRLGLKPKGRWYEVLDLTDCRLLSPETPKLLAAVRAWALERGIPPYNSRKHEGVLRHLVLREAKNRPERMALLVTAPAEIEREGFLQTVRSVYPATTVLHGLNAKLSDTSHPDSLEAWAGPGFIEEELDLGDRRVRFRISPTSFFQTNTLGAQLLYGKLRAWVRQAAPVRALDLYCGGGGIGLSIADLCGELLGVEQNPAAAQDAAANARLNAIENTRFKAGSAEKCLEELAAFGADFIIVDPPRSGLHKAVVEALIQARPKRLAYVSCNPDSLARDLALLGETFAVETAEAVDLFPHTEHVESLALLSPKA